MEMVFRLLILLFLCISFGRFTASSSTCPWPCVCIPLRNEVRCYGSNLTNERVVEIAREVPQLSQVYHLYIRGGEFDKFPALTFRGNPHLRSLHIDQNKLKAIPLNLSNVFPNLELLNIAENHIKEITKKSLRGLSALKTLNLKKNFISKMEDGSFVDTVKLEILDFSWNNLTTLSSKPFAHAQNIVSLNLNRNQIKQLPPGLLHGFTSARLSIRIAHNNITAIPNGLFSNGTNPTLLDLSYNQIRKIADKAFANVTRFGTVFLENNALRGMPRSALEGVVSGTFIMFNNPLVCSCEMYTKLVPYFTKKLQFVGTCAEPTHLQDQSLASLMVNVTVQEACPICERLGVTCANDGICVSVDRSNFKCNCTRGYMGMLCEYQSQIAATAYSTKRTATTTTTPSATSTTIRTSTTNSSLPRFIDAGNMTFQIADKLTENDKGLLKTMVEHTGNASASKIVCFLLIAVFVLAVLTKAVCSIRRMRLDKQNHKEHLLSET